MIRKAMAWAEVVDAWRVFPRFMVVAYGWLVEYVLVSTLLWYFALPPSARTLEVTAFFGMLTGGLFGLAAYVFKTYTDGGFDWEKYHARFKHQIIPVDRTRAVPPSGG